MSQFPPPDQGYQGYPPHQAYYDPTMQPPAGQGGRSGLAVTALVFSLIGILPCCFGVPAPIGVLLGLIGMVAIKPPRKGRGMSLAAVIIGILGTIAYAWFWVWAVQMAWPILEGPRKALEEGFAGNTAAFKSEFVGDGATASDEEVRDFIEQLRSRYGEFQSSWMDEQSQRQPKPGDTNFVQDYLFEFSNATRVRAEAVYVMADNRGFVQKWESITIVDPIRGDITYPPNATAAPAPRAPSATGPADGDEGGDVDDNGDGDGGAATGDERDEPGTL